MPEAGLRALLEAAQLPERIDGSAPANGSEGAAADAEEDRHVTANYLLGLLGSPLLAANISKRFEKARPVLTKNKTAENINNASSTAVRITVKGAGSGDARRLVIAALERAGWMIVGDALAPMNLKSPFTARPPKTIDEIRQEVRAELVAQLNYNVPPPSNGRFLTPEHLLAMADRIDCTDPDTFIPVKIKHTRKKRKATKRKSR